jgi:uncharacterized Rmd1/YagE family protein
VYAVLQEQPGHPVLCLLCSRINQDTGHTVKLAISHALAQSTKLAVYEERILEVVRESRNLPEALARHGEVHISQKKIAQLIGQVCCGLK